VTIPSKRAVPEQPVFTANRTVEVKLNKGYLEESFTIRIDGTTTVTAAATSTVPRGSVLQEVRLLGDQSEVLQAWKAHDLVIEQEVYEQNIESNQITLPSTAIGGPYPFSSTHTLAMREPFAGKLGDLTMLPTWLYTSLTLQLVFTDITGIYVGGTATLGGVGGVPQVTVTQNGVLDYPMPTEFAGNTVAFGRALGKALKSYDEETFSGAKPQFTVDVPLTHDVRSMVMLAYNAAGNLDDTVINNVTFKVNGNTDVNSRQPWLALKGENARVFGVPMPAGVAILESSEDKDIRNIYEISGYSKASLIFETTAAGMVRVAYRKLSAGRG
jgi:hypothetical protein